MMLSRLAAILAAVSLCLQPALAAPKRAVVVSDGSIKPLPAGDTLRVNASAAGGASINLGQGTAPSAPVNGDVWITADGVYARVAGVTIGPFVDEAGAGGSAGTVTSVAVSGGATGLTTSGGPVTDAGTITLAGTLDLDNGGTGATTASGARSALGLAIGSDVQGYDADLTTYGGIAPSANVQTLLGAADFAAFRSSLGLGTLATQSGTFSGTSSGTNTGDQTSIVGITGTLAQFNTALSDGDFVTGGGTATGTNTGDQTSIVGLTGSVAQFNAALTGADFATGGGTATGTNTGDQDLSGYATTAAVAAGYQPLDGDLTSIAALATTAAGRALLDDADAAAQRSTLGLGTLATQSGTFSGTSSGTNTGDQASIVGISGTLAEFNAALTGADFATGGGTATGANTGDQTITLTGDVTGSGTGSFATAIGANTVALGDLAQVATARVLGRASAGTGNVEALTGTQATALLDVFTSADKGLAPASGGGTSNFLRADGTWAAPAGGGGGPTVIAGASGAASSGAAGSETWQVLTANATANATATIATVMTTTALPAGTWKYRYDIVAQAAAATTSLKFSVDAGGTVTRHLYHLFFPSQGVTAATGVADQDINVTTGAVWSHLSARADNVTLGPTTDVDTANADVHYVIEGVLVTTTSGNLLLGHASEVAASSQVMAGTHLQLQRLN